MFFITALCAAYDFTYLITAPPPRKFRNLTFPFAWETLHGFPLPTVSAVFALVLLFGISFWWCEGFSKDAAAIIRASKLAGSLVSFLKKERQRESHPSVLIAGSSANGFGIYTALLEERLGRSTGKATLHGGGLWECERILKKYQHETENVKIVFLDLLVICGGSATGSQKGNTFRVLHDFSDDGDVRLYESLHQKGIVLESREDLFINQLFPYRMSFHDLKNCLKLKSSDHESSWTHADHIENCKALQAELVRYVNNTTYEPQNTGTKEYIRRHRSLCVKYNDEMESLTFDIIQRCEKRGVFVVFTVLPRWRTFPLLPDPNDPNLTESQKKYLELFDKLDAHPNCRVIVLKDFQTLIPGAVDAEYLFDTHHMTKNGATVYTHWLADQTLRDEKICAHLEIPCQTDAQTDFPKLIAELGMTVPNNETRVAETSTMVK